MNKKIYIKPCIQVYPIEPASLLTGSPGDNYDGIDFNNNYCTQPE